MVRPTFPLVRAIAERLNNRFGELLVTPASWDKQLEFANQQISVRIHSLTKPENKMSKSIDDPRGTIGLLDDPGEAADKIMSATTDSIGIINFDFQNQPGISNLLQLLALMQTERSLDQIISVWTGKSSYGELKEQVANVVQKFLTDFQSKYNEIDDDRVHKILQSGEIVANQIANETLLKVQRAVGLR